MELCFVFLRTCIRYHVQSAMSSTFYIFFIFLDLKVYFLSNCTSYLRNLFNVTVQYSCTTAVSNSYLRFFQEGNSMTILKCSAMTCVYNKEQLCSKGDIDVTGENATSANETSCGSFRERTERQLYRRMRLRQNPDRLQSPQLYL